MFVELKVRGCWSWVGRQERERCPVHKEPGRKPHHTGTARQPLPGLLAEGADLGLADSGRNRKTLCDLGLPPAS